MSDEVKGTQDTGDAPSVPPVPTTTRSGDTQPIPEQGAQGFAQPNTKDQSYTGTPQWQAGADTQQDTAPFQSRPAAGSGSGNTGVRTKIWPSFVSGLVGAVLGLSIGAGVTVHMLDSNSGDGGGNASTTSSVISRVTSDDDSGSQSSPTSASSSDEVSLAEEVSKKDLDSVVTLDVVAQSSSPLYGTTESGGVGSGVILTEDGYILTNSHVVEGGTEITTEIDGVTYAAELVGEDPSSDLAVVKIDATGLDPIEIGSSSDLEVGQWVATIGSPFGYEKSVSSGIVSALYRSTAMASDSGYNIYANLIQTDASINPGNSGGALVDADGKLIGITTLFSSYSGSSSNVGFAIPIDYAYRVATQIMNGEQVTHAYLGVSLATVDSTVARQYQLSEETGAFVSEVYDGTAAADAGLQAGDIITGADGADISTADELIIAVRSKTEGDTMELTYVRDGRENTVTVTLGSDASADSES